MEFIRKYGVIIGSLLVSIVLGLVLANLLMNHANFDIINQYGVYFLILAFAYIPQTYLMRRLIKFASEDKKGTLKENVVSLIPFFNTPAIREFRFGSAVGGYVLTAIFVVSILIKLITVNILANGATLVANNESVNMSFYSTVGDIAILNSYLMIIMFVAYWVLSAKVALDINNLIDKQQWIVIAIALPPLCMFLDAQSIPHYYKEFKESKDNLIDGE